MNDKGNSEHGNEATIAGMLRMPPQYIDSECYRLLNAPSLPEWHVGSRGRAAYWKGGYETN